MNRSVIGEKYNLKQKVAKEAFADIYIHAYVCIHYIYICVHDVPVCV